MNQQINRLRNEMRSELENNILPFWMNKMEDNEQGGFYGEITGNDELRPEASKGAILNARILWTFSAAYRLLKKPEYLKTATRPEDRHPRQTVSDRPLLRPRIRRHLLGTRLQRQSARHEETDLRYRFRHLRSERICPCHRRCRSLGICPAAFRGHRTA